MSKFLKIPTGLPDLFLIEPRVFKDKRGFLMESWNQKGFSEIGLELEFVQDNHSRSRRGVLRGLHFQDPHPQGKLIRVVRGSIFDVAVDLRDSSPTFGKWWGTILDEENLRMLYVPPGFAHGFLVLSEWADVLYKATDYYHPECEGGIRWDDPDLAITWPLREHGISKPLLSSKDEEWPSLREWLRKKREKR
ncbi:MAG: dTDP-4-dehydrorhamnose 3,5-epimerase [Candidatus Atribacteria bacterium]|nr:dTDP-4-dehydrorhamnose 3,5-epimerase [Candidatus Atribacteria bacterium]MCD6349420.1 dTDP-4-dehydrorhamnose 3,5-epimerase [Candidatus Atribacteria bacterium]